MDFPTALEIENSWHRTEDLLPTNDRQVLAFPKPIKGNGDWKVIMWLTNINTWNNRDGVAKAPYIWKYLDEESTKKLTRMAFSISAKSDDKHRLYARVIADWYGRIALTENQITSFLSKYYAYQNSLSGKNKEIMSLDNIVKYLGCKTGRWGTEIIEVTLLNEVLESSIKNVYSTDDIENIREPWEVFEQFKSLFVY